MADIITIEECITRLDTIRHEIVPDSRDHFAISAGIAALYEMQKDAPAVNRWIPCSERLPKNEDPCAVVTVNGGLGVSRMMGRNLIEWTLFGERVIYWMPLPEPPEKRR